LMRRGSSSEIVTMPRILSVTILFYTRKPKSLVTMALELGVWESKDKSNEDVPRMRLR
jgi:hypothetical protein